MSKKRLIIINLVTLLAAVSLLFAAAPAANGQSQTSLLRMEARAAFDGHFKFGEWLLLWVQLDNPGPDLNGEVQVRVTGRGGTAVFAAPVSMPTGSRKLIPLYALPNNFTHALEVRYVSGSQALVTQTVAVRAQPNINYLVGIASPERGPLSQLTSVRLPGMARKVTPVDFSILELPDRAEGLRSFDALILNGTDTSTLTPQQKSALEGWVRQGGRLILGGGAQMQQVTSGLAGELAPALGTGFHELDELPGLEELARGEEIRVQGPFVVAALSQVAGQVLAADGAQVPLVVEKNLGNGFINLVALDLISSPFNAWAGLVPFWETLLSPNASYAEWLPPDMSARQMTANQMTYALSNLPSLDLPSVRGLALLLVFYIGLVGPVNYLLLRWQKRLQWAWVTIPLITLIFSAGAFSLGYLLRGNDLLLNRVVIAEIQPGGSAYTRSYYGLFSPTQTSYEIEVSGGGLLSQLNADYDPWSAAPGAAGEVVFVQGDPGRLRGLSVNQWSMQTFTRESNVEGFGSLENDLVLEGTRLHGSIRNATDLQLSGVVLVFSNQIIRLGDMAPGETKNVDTEISNLVGQVFGPPLSYQIFEQEFNQPRSGPLPRELSLKQSIIDSLMPYGSGFAPLSGKFSGSSGSMPGQLVILGWFEAPAGEVRISGRVPAEQTTGLVYAQIPYRYAMDGSVTLPPGIIPGSLVEMPSEGGTCGPGGTLSVYIGRGSGVFEFRLPHEYDEFEFDNLLVHIGTEGGWMRIPEISLYDWDAEGWQVIENAQPGTTAIAFQEELRSSSNTVRVRLNSADGLVSGCYYVGLGLEGRQ